MRVTAETQATAKRMFLNLVSDLWNHFHHLPREDNWKMGHFSGEHLPECLSTNRRSNNRYDICLSSEYLAYKTAVSFELMPAAVDRHVTLKET